MSKLTVVAGVIAVFALPGLATADRPAAQEHQQAARAQCKSERGKTGATREAFRARYGSMSRCVREKAAEEAAEDVRNAAKACAAELRSLGIEQFRAKYGKNRNDRNAFGKCVSSRTGDA